MFIYFLEFLHHISLVFFVVVVVIHTQRKCLNSWIYASRCDFSESINSNTKMKSSATTTEKKAHKICLQKYSQLQLIGINRMYANLLVFWCIDFGFSKRFEWIIQVMAIIREIALSKPHELLAQLFARHYVAFKLLLVFFSLRKSIRYLDILFLRYPHILRTVFFSLQLVSIFNHGFIFLQK